MKGLNLQMEMQTDMLRKLRADKMSLEQELTHLKTSDKEKITAKTKHWEQTCDDLTRELNNAHSELAERDHATK